VTAKTNAARLLDQAGIGYRLQGYHLDMEEFTATRVAALIGMSPDQVFKTLLVIGDRSGPCFAVVPADTELDLKAFARVSGNRKAALASLKEVLPLTGYPRGAVTVIGARRPYPAYLDETAELFDEIAVSAGARGVQVVVGTTDYVSLTGAIVADIAG
jgi:Cys-tRNA(Pro)/Cys-tRNA(Cys) deacylase